MEKKVKEIKKGKDDSKENFDLSDIEKNSQDGFLLGVISEAPSFETDLCSIDFDSNLSTIKETTASLEAVCLDNQDNNLIDSATVEKEAEISSCVVCDKKFKSKSCMNKHLRSVHAG